MTTTSPETTVSPETSKPETGFVLCIDNTDCDDLQKGKVYALIPDAKASSEGYVRIIDEGGEDYLYPQSQFLPIDIPPKGREALSTAS